MITPVYEHSSAERQVLSFMLDASVMSPVQDASVMEASHARIRHTATCVIVMAFYTNVILSATPASTPHRSKADKRQYKSVYGRSSFAHNNMLKVLQNFKHVITCDGVMTS